MLLSCPQLVRLCDASSIRLSRIKSLFFAWSSFRLWTSSSFSPEEHPMLSFLACQEFPLELMRKLTADEDDSDGARCGWLAEEEKELQKVEEASPLDLCLCVQTSFCWSSLWFLPLSPEGRFMPALRMPAGPSSGPTRLSRLILGILGNSDTSTHMGFTAAFVAWACDGAAKSTPEFSELFKGPDLIGCGGRKPGVPPESRSEEAAVKDRALCEAVKEGRLVDLWAVGLFVELQKSSGRRPSLCSDGSSSLMRLLASLQLSSPLAVTADEKKKENR